ncbi:hypothetical protein F2Q70_00038068 [Brassica cretica]|uniref:Protein CHUP1, chloroplastic n=1 Tax=Brassica cretica TaxID=69181 RepID=A0A8S9K1Q2_BRACR|nr:hypothetical protein F2Q70_00038068 [Brassica cretica]
MLPNGEDDSDLMRLVKELQASLMKNEKLEKENHELRQEVARLRAQVSNLKAHDNERKSMLWKKLQSSYDGGNTDASNLKAPESAKPNIKGHEVKNPNLKPMVKEQSTAIKPPPPPPLPSKTTLGKRSIKSDTDRHREHIHFLISKVDAATFTDISEVETFVKWIDDELSSLVDERAVLKHFPKWPERKADSLREAACIYRALKSLETEILSFKENPKEPLKQVLQKIQSLEEAVNSTERTRESTGKRYKDFQIPWEWMLDAGLIGQLKYSSLRLAQAYMKRITKELESNGGGKEGNLLHQGVRFAYTIHQFAGGFDEESLRIFNELKKMATSESQKINK